MIEGKGHSEGELVKWFASAYRSADPDRVHVKFDSRMPQRDHVPERVRIEVVLDSGGRTWEPPASGVMFVEWHSRTSGVLHPLGDNCCDGDLSFTFSALLPVLQQAGYIHDGMLRLRISIAWKQKPDVCASTSVLDKLASTFGSDDFSDMQVVAQGKTLNVHRNVLAAQSPVFRGMISTSMKETLQGRLEIADMDSTTAHAFFKYLYSGTVEDMCCSGGVPEGPWYVVHEFGSHPPSVCHLTHERGYLEKAALCHIHKQGETLLVKYKDAQVPVEQVPVEQEGEQEGERNLWYSSHTTDDIVDTSIEFLDWYIRLERDFETAILHSKDGEIKFAEFWGRLLVAADKYCVEDLVKACSERMIQRVSVWSASTMLQFACLAKQHSLKRDLINFMTLTGDIFSDVRDMPEFDSLDANLRDELADVFVGKQRRVAAKKRPPDDAYEFLDGQDWGRLSRAQLRRACVERGLEVSGGRDEMAALLRAHEGKHEGEEADEEGEE
eukprot:TRINITY_DN32080_c0_g1_i1.p1 TRINITY_DN32080_c0_g1~~TRINITY_DN32080_c0_g1_i1.p1  ORF type:complete len:547 (-),score=75.53 TRINITY_DN32080_c0_g1_i1:82-1572(-)